MTAYVPSVALSRAYLCHNGSHEPFFCMQYRWTQVEWKRYLFSCNSGCFSGIALLISVDVLLLQEKRDCSGLLTCYRWWNQYCLVDGVQSFLLFRYWIYYSATRCVLKNLPNNPRALTEWCSCLTSCAFLWSASVVSHWSSCSQWLRSVWLQSVQIS